MTTPFRAPFAVALVLLLAGCASASMSPTPPDVTASPAASPSEDASTAPTHVPTPSPTPEGSATARPTATPPATGGVIVTFRVAGEEEYRVRLTDPADIEIARMLLAGEEAPRIPNGVVRQGDAGVNEPWSWHIDPEDFEFADFTIEVCDGLPSDVESGTVSGPRFCPWSAVVVDLEEG